MIKALGGLFLIFLLTVPPCGAFKMDKNRSAAFAVIQSAITKKNVHFETILNPVRQGFSSSETFGMTAASFKGHLYAAVWDWHGGVKLLRSADGDRWEAVSLEHLHLNSCYSDAYQLYEYNGQLYMAVNDCWLCNLPALILRSPDGLAWEVSFQDTADHALLGQALPDKLGGVNGYLYFTTRGHTGQIWRSPTGDPGSWQVANASLGRFVDSTSPPIQFRGEIFLSNHDENGVHVWHSLDGLAWQSSGQGVLDTSDNLFDGSLVVFKNTLYLSTANWKHQVPFAGGRIYRSSDGIQWTEVVTDAFGSSHGGGIEGLVVRKGVLYAFSGDPCDKTLVIWSSRTGNKGGWTRIEGEGLGPRVYSLHSGQVEFKGDIYIANSFNQGEDVNLIRMSWK